VVVTGTPEDVAANKDSYTGHFLKPVLGVSTESHGKRTGTRR
jgi:excinuclease ABC subunit A